MKTKIILMLTICLAAAGSAVWAGEEVSQGRFIGAEAGRLTIEEYDVNFSAENPYGMPTGIISEYDVSKAKIGIQPEAGDILRIAYDDNGEVKRATKVMNVSKQDLRKK